MNNFDDLETLDINRNLTRDSNGGTVSIANDYRGWGAADAPAASGETAAVYSLLDGVPFSQTGAITSASFFPRAGATVARTGAAILDVHTPLNKVSFSAAGPAPTANRFAQLANGVAKALGQGLAEADAATWGTSEYLGRQVYGVPSATLELRVDDDLKQWLDVTRPDLGFTNPQDLFFFNGLNQSFADRVAAVRKAFLAAADVASGPGYLKQVTITLGAGLRTYDMSKVGRPTEVLYHARLEPVGTDRRKVMNRLEGFPGERFLNATSANPGAPVPVTVFLSFSKPMAQAANALTKRPEQLALSGFELEQGGFGVVARLLDYVVEGSERWLGADDPLMTELGPALTPGALRYEHDTWMATINVPTSRLGGNGWAVRSGRLLVKAKDEVDFHLDGGPTTVAKIENGVYRDYEDANASPAPSNDGGTDVSHGTFKIDTIAPKLEAFGNRD